MGKGRLMDGLQGFLFSNVYHVKLLNLLDCKKTSQSKSTGLKIGMYPYLLVTLFFSEINFLLHLF